MLVNMQCLSAPNSPCCTLLCMASAGALPAVSSLPAGFLLGYPEGKREGKDLLSSLLLAILINSAPSSNSWPQFSALVGTHRMRLVVLQRYQEQIGSDSSSEIQDPTSQLS